LWENEKKKKKSKGLGAVGVIRKEKKRGFGIIRGEGGKKETN